MIELHPETFEIERLALEHKGRPYDQTQSRGPGVREHTYMCQQCGDKVLRFAQKLESTALEKLPY